ncbi:hypothetical protein HK103_004129 [Boothiomyces macroporosus]|uniref:Uncharacterized protein n=1 Tax=Boothiomyces macroporosus TaxID=261099 RepID=A0AAD5UH49_9FUNG|nr:hypothetical protein HK103_004129 [Boothiomyces macroporosus]
MTFLFGALLVQGNPVELVKRGTKVPYACIVSKDPDTRFHLKFCVNHTKEGCKSILDNARADGNWIMNWQCWDAGNGMYYADGTIWEGNGFYVGYGACKAAIENGSTGYATQVPVDDAILSC